MTADGDVIARAQPVGPDRRRWTLATDGFTHLATDAATTPDGVTRDGASGHSEYPRTGANGRLRTSGYNLAAIIADLPERAVTTCSPPPRSGSAGTRGASGIAHLRADNPGVSSNQVPPKGRER